MLLEIALIPFVLASTPDTLISASVSAVRSEAAVSTAPVQSISAASVSRLGMRDISEAVRTFAGVDVKDYGGIGGLKTVSVHGMGAQHTAVTYNGMPVSDMCSGQTDLSRFDLTGVSEIRLETGVSDEIFRSARTLAAGSVLSIRTERPDAAAGGSPSGSLSAGRASFGTWRADASGHACMSGFHAEGRLHALVSDGDYPFVLRNGRYTEQLRRLGSDVSTASYGLLLSRHLHGVGDISAELRGYSSDRGLPGSVIYYTQNPTERLRDRETAVALRYSGSAGQWRWRADASYLCSRQRYTDTAAVYPVPVDDRYRQLEWALSAAAEYVFSPHFRMVIAQDLWLSDLDADIAGCPYPRRYSGVSALSAQYRSGRLTVTGSLSMTATHEVTERGEAAPDRHRLCPQIGVNWLAGSGVRLRAYAKDGYRVPTFNDLYYSRIGTVDLVPEKARQAGCGLTWSGSLPAGALTVTADAFAAAVRDKIVAVPTMFIWKMRNLGRVNMRCADISVSYAGRISGRYMLRAAANCSYCRAVDVSDPGSKIYRHQIQYTPLYSGNATLSLETPWVDAGAVLNAVGERYSLPQNIPSNAMSPYCDISLSLSRTFALRAYRLQFAAEALNLLNDNYEVVRHYPMPGCNWRLTMKINI